MGHLSTTSTIGMYGFEPFRLISCVRGAPRIPKSASGVPANTRQAMARAFSAKVPSCPYSQGRLSPLRGRRGFRIPGAATACAVRCLFLPEQPLRVAAEGSQRASRVHSLFRQTHSRANFIPLLFHSSVLALRIPRGLGSVGQDPGMIGAAI